MRRITTIADASQLANELRADWPEKAAAIERAIADAQDGKRDGVNITVNVRFKLEKFHGVMTPGQTPFEVIEGQG